MLMETTIKLDTGTTKRIGMFDDEEKIWYIGRNENKHFMKKLDSWGLDEKMYETLKLSYGLKKVILTEKNSFKRYECFLKDIEDHKIFKHFKPYRLQIFIPRKHWKKLHDD